MDLHHDIDVVAGGALAEIYPGVSRVRVNSVHHQGLKTVSERLRVEAASVEDGVVEGVSLKSTTGWCIGVQWHLSLSTLGFLSFWTEDR